MKTTGPACKHCCNLPRGSDVFGPLRRSHLHKKNLSSKNRHANRKQMIALDTVEYNPSIRLQRIRQSKSEMKIFSVTRASRSNSHSMSHEAEHPTIDPAKTLFSQTIDDISNANHPTSTESVSPDSSEAPPRGEVRRVTIQSDSGHDTNYASIPAVGASLVPINVQSSASPVAHRGRLFGKCPKNRRLVQKNGHSNVTLTRVKKKKFMYIRDLFTTIMDLKWRYHILLFVSAFSLSWLVFGLAWLAVAHYNGDIARPDGDNATDICIMNVYDFSTALLFSLETQTTIGYGFRIIGEHCPLGTILIMAQSVVGIFIQCFITGIVFGKIARPKHRAQTIVFSRNAVVCMRDGFYNLIFRVGDLRKTHIIGTSIRALLVKSRQTSEGELIPLCQYPLDLVTESSMTDSFVFFFWPVTIAHRITESSQLWNLSAESILTDHFEIIVILEGTVQTSGSLIQIRSSYIPSEIKWGQRLAPLVTTLRGNDDYEIDYSNFHETSPVSMPDCSARDYAELRATNSVQYIEPEYPASFTTPAPAAVQSNDGRKDKRSSSLQALKNLFPKFSKQNKNRNSSNDTSCREEVEQKETNITASPPEVVVHSGFPPTYASLTASNGDGALEGTSMETQPGVIIRVYDETGRIIAPERKPVRPEYTGLVNMAFVTSSV